MSYYGGILDKNGIDRTYPDVLFIGVKWLDKLDDGRSYNGTLVALIQGENIPLGQLTIEFDSNWLEGGTAEVLAIVAAELQREPGRDPDKRVRRIIYGDRW